MKPTENRSAQPETRQAVPVCRDGEIVAVPLSTEQQARVAELTKEVNPKDAA